MRWPFLKSVRTAPVLIAAAMMAGLPSNEFGQTVAANAAGTSAIESQGFVDVTKSSGVADAVTRHYQRHPKWWLSGLNLVDLDGDGQLDLFLGRTVRGVPWPCSTMGTAISRKRRVRIRPRRFIWQPTSTRMASWTCR